MNFHSQNLGCGCRCFYHRGKAGRPAWNYNNRRTKNNQDKKLKANTGLRVALRRHMICSGHRCRYLYILWCLVIRFLYFFLQENSQIHVNIEREYSKSYLVTGHDEEDSSGFYSLCNFEKKFENYDLSYRNIPILWESPIYIHNVKVPIQERFCKS